MAGDVSNDAGCCRRCGGRIVATHMLTRTYDVGEDGRWRRKLDDFTEDVVVVCLGCGQEPEGRYEADDGAFAFLPVAGAGESAESSGGGMPQ
jgi:hypothetical protein